VGAAELLEGGGLAGGLLAGHDQPAAGADLPAVQQGQQPTRPGDLADGRRRHDDHLGVVVKPGLVVCLPVLAGQSRPPLVRQQVEAGGRGVDEPPPARERHGRLPPTIVQSGAARRDVVRDAHHHFFASSRASKTPRGITSARGPSSSSSSSQASGCRRGDGSGSSGREGPAAAAALARAPAFRSRRACLPRAGPCPALSSSAAAARAISASVAWSWPRRARTCRAWSHACSPKGAGAARRCVHGARIQPPSPRWSRTSLN
jgi:hypothetical protein